MIAGNDGGDGRPGQFDRKHREEPVWGIGRLAVAQTLIKADTVLVAIADRYRSQTVRSSWRSAALNCNSTDLRYPRRVDQYGTTSRCPSLLQPRRNLDRRETCVASIAYLIDS